MVADRAWCIILKLRLANEIARTKQTLHSYASRHCAREPVRDWCSYRSGEVESVPGRVFGIIPEQETVVVQSASSDRTSLRIALP
ncbi:uncharacterized protein ARMOST_02563 [Armillaria ostoyae]|uniref:Uncharacterized protein n=1 Tax=Armillaria ostoyae TaxID=47428 RepID=A0A284QS17_ARMOS|nr:uncharacterized protein ARMOST_02563 [Armillaria ostoyae]